LVALTAILGAIPIAVMIAAFAVPVVYIVYLYDVNLWEDEPVTVTGAASRSRSHCRSAGR